MTSSEQAETYHGALRHLWWQADHSGHAALGRAHPWSVAQGVTPEAIREDYPDLEPEDVRSCVAYAHAVTTRDCPRSSCEKIRSGGCCR